MTPKEELNKSLDELTKPKEKETPNEYLKRMEEEFVLFCEDFNKLSKLNKP